LIDYNLRGKSALLWGTIAAEGWLELMPIRFVGFEEVGLLESSSDRLVWQFAQSNQMIILTANRNVKGDDSLETEVRQLTIDNSVQQQRLSDVEPLIAERLALLQQFVDLVRQNKLMQTDRDNISKQNFLLQQKIEPRPYAMDQTERTLLRQRTDTTDRTVQ